MRYCSAPGSHSWPPCPPAPPRSDHGRQHGARSGVEDAADLGQQPATRSSGPGRPANRGTTWRRAASTGRRLGRRHARRVHVPAPPVTTRSTPVSSTRPPWPARHRRRSLRPRPRPRAVQHRSTRGGDEITVDPARSRRADSTRRGRGCAGRAGPLGQAAEAAVPRLRAVRGHSGWCAPASACGRSASRPGRGLRHPPRPAPRALPRPAAGTRPRGQRVGRARPRTSPSAERPAVNRCAGAVARRCSATTCCAESSASRGRRTRCSRSSRTAHNLEAITPPWLRFRVVTPRRSRCAPAR